MRFGSVCVFGVTHGLRRITGLGTNVKVKVLTADVQRQLLGYTSSFLVDGVTFVLTLVSSCESLENERVSTHDVRR